MNTLEAETLTVSEAAVVSSISVREVNRAIDEKFLPAPLYATGQERLRRFSAKACVLLSFYFNAANRLTAEERLRVIALASQQWNEGPEIAFEKEWLIRREFLTVDLAPFLREVRQRLAQLKVARAQVVEDPEILRGTPVIRGTRVPVYDVASSVAAGEPLPRILEAYPSLTGKDIELAALYAKAVPLRGRPNTAPILPVNAVVLSHYRAPRKQALKKAS